MTYNIRTASAWANRDGGDRAHGRTWRERRLKVLKVIEIAGWPAVLGTQEGLAWQLDDLVGLLGPSYRRVGAGRLGDGSDSDEHAAILFDSARLELVDSTDFWLSETPSEKASIAWGAALPRVATHAMFRRRRRRPGGVVETPSSSPYGVSSSADDDDDGDDATDGVDPALTSELFGVLNAHFDHASEEARTRSAGVVRAFAAAHRDTLAFVLGDFNAAKDEAWFAELSGDGGLADAWGLADSVSCGACAASTYHAWRGAENTSRIGMSSETSQREVAVSGSQHVDAVFCAPSFLARHGWRVARARVVTDDRRRSVYGGPFASDHYPVVVTVGLGDDDQHLGEAAETGHPNQSGPTLSSSSPVGGGAPGDPTRPAASADAHTSPASSSEL